MKILKTINNLIISLFLKAKSILAELAMITGVWGPETWPEWKPLEDNDEE